MAALTCAVAAAGPDRPGPREDKQQRPGREGEEVLADPRRLPAAATSLGQLHKRRRPHVQGLFVLTLLSAVDGSLLALAAAGRLSSLADALTVGLVVIAGAGSWLAANQAFAGRPRGASDWGLLAALGALTFASTLAAVWLGQRLGDAMTLHVLPKGAGIVLFAVAAQVAGVRLPAAGRIPLPAAALAAFLALEVLLQWTA